MRRFDVTKLPLSRLRFGLPKHAVEKKAAKRAGTLILLYVYTLCHLRVFAGMYGFKVRVLKRIKHGAHLYAEFVK